MFIFGNTNTNGAAATLLFLCCLAACAKAPAQITEDVVQIPVTVKDIFNHEYTQNITVTLFHDASRKKAPFLVLSHGRPANAAQFVQMGRQRFTVNSKYFVEKGFAVLVPTRVGYGVSAGPDVEFSGNSCGARNYPDSIGAAIAQVYATVKFAGTLPYVDASRGLLVGQSVGGMTTIGAAARNIYGVVGAVNFAGGAGGDPDGRPEKPCSPDKLEDFYRNAGARAEMPTLWLYSENDRFWGATLPHEWFNAFVAAGGKGKFMQLPPYQQNGHGIFTGNPESWKSAFEAFILELGFPGK